MSIPILIYLKHKINCNMNMLSAEEVQTFKNNLCIPDLMAKANRMEHFCYFSKYQSLPFFMENYESVLMFLSKTLLPLYYLKAKLKVHLIIDDNQLAIVKNNRLLIINHREREIKGNILVTEKRCGIYYITSISGSKLAFGTNYPNGLCFIVDITHNLVQELKMGELINGLSYSGNSNILLVLTRNKYIIYYLEDDKRIYSNLYSTQRHVMRYGENQWIAATTLGFLCIHVFNYQEQEPHLVTTHIINRKRGRDPISCMTLIDENLLAIGTEKGFI